jgi:nicotinate phosphoribosyltransferase
VEYKSKFSEEKVYSPGRKQVFRFSDGAQYHHDLIARSSEKPSGGTPLLHPVMRQGRRLRSRPRLQDSRINVLADLDLLPEPYHALHDAPTYPVGKSEALQRLLEEIRQQTLGARERSR